MAIRQRRIILEPRFVRQRDPMRRLLPAVGGSSEHVDSSGPAKVCFAQCVQALPSFVPRVGQAFEALVGLLKPARQPRALPQASFAIVRSDETTKSAVKILD